MLTKSRSNYPLRSRKFLISTVIILLVLAGTLVVLEKKGIINLYGRGKDNQAQNYGEDGINYSPPTDEEKAAGDRQKQQIDEEQNRSDKIPSDGSSKKSVSVIITDASQYGSVVEVRSFMPNYFQDGTCTITLSKSDLKVVKSAPAYRDVSGTICTNPEILRSEFSESGDWQVVVTFDSSDAAGSSDPQTVTIN